MKLDDDNKIPELDDNNKIPESYSEYKGLYILSSPLLDEKQVIKFGMSECLQNRISAYSSYFKNPYYMACYKFDDNHTKSEILAAETGILNITLQYETDDFTSEYRLMEFGILHNIVCDYLNKNGIVYTPFIRPIWKRLTKINTIIKHEYFNTNRPNQDILEELSLSTMENKLLLSLEIQNKLLETKIKIIDDQEEMNNNDNTIVKYEYSNTDKSNQDILKGLSFTEIKNKLLLSLETQNKLLEKKIKVINNHAEMNNKNKQLEEEIKNKDKQLEEKNKQLKKAMTSN